MEGLFVVMIMLSVFIFPMIGAAIADDRGYHACLGAAIGFFGGILGILILLVIPRQERPPEGLVGPEAGQAGPSEQPMRPEAEQERFNRPHWEP